MDQIAAFKQFIRTMPKASEAVHDGLYTWQELYELYDLYGENHEVWKKFSSEKSTPKASGSTNFDLSSLVALLKTVDVDALLSSMQGLEKVLGIAAALFDKDDTPKSDYQSLSRMDD